MDKQIATLEKLMAEWLADAANLRRAGVNAPWFDQGQASSLERCADNLRAAIALMRGQSWQPIETAPKGKHVIVWDGELMLPSYWGKVSHVPIYGWLNLFNDAENVELMDPQPTLWTHYPDRPKDTADE